MGLESRGQELETLEGEGSSGSVGTYLLEAFVVVHEVKYGWDVA